MKFPGVWNKQLEDFLGVNKKTRETFRGDSKKPYGISKSLVLLSGIPKGEVTHLEIPKFFSKVHVFKPSSFNFF